MTSETSGSVYQIRVRTLWNPVWAVRFPGFVVSHDSAGYTVLTGRVVDQAMLYGLISRMRDLGLQLISLEQLQGRDGVGDP